jgi:hydrophobe/amphiphile efflux-1 (HAE1) family protein
MGLSDFCIRRPIFATVLSLIIVLAGLLSIRVLPLSQYPDIRPPSVRISTTYDGADAQTIARTVAAPIEDQLSGIDGLLYYITNIRSNGDMIINCTFDVGTDPNDAMLEINNRVRQAERRLPESVRQQGINVRKRSEENLLMLVLYSPDKSMSRIDMADYAYLNIVDELKRLPGISDVTVTGNTQSALRIWVDPQKMGELGVTVSDVEAAVEEQNTQRSAGSVGTSPTPDDQQLTYTVTAPGRLLTPDQFADIIVKNDGPNGIVRIRDIGSTEVGNRSYQFRVDINGSPGVNIGVYLQTGANAMAAAAEVKAKIAELERYFPKGKLAYQIADDSSVYAGASLHEVYVTLGEAMLLVLAVIFLFLQSWRATIIPLVAIPVSLIGTMAGLWALGFSLNTLTLFAMTLAIGIVVDDAIVVIENVERIMRTEKLSAFKAAQKAMHEVAGALVAIVLVLSSVFIPVAFLGGMAGTLYRQFAVTISIAVVLSGFVALTLTPALCALLMKERREEDKPAFFRAFDAGLARFTMMFLRVVKGALRHRVLSALLLAAVTAAVWTMFQSTPTSFLPKEDQGLVRMTLKLPEGAAFPRTEAVAGDFLKRILAMPAVRSNITMMGNDSMSGDMTSNAASFIVHLKDWDQRTESAEDVQRSLQKMIRASHEATGAASLPAPISGLGSTNGFSGFVVAHGNDNALSLQEVTNSFVERLSERSELTSTRTFLSADTPQLLMTVDETKAKALGVDVDDVYSTVSDLMGSKYINDFTRNGKNYRVILQAKTEFRTSPEDLGAGYVRSSSGKMVPISSLITVERNSGASSLTHMNGYLAARFSGAAAQGVSSGEAIALVEQMAAEYLPEGYTIEWVDQAYHEKRIGTSSLVAIGFGMLMMFLILAALYERWSLPIAVVLAVPYALLGALVSLWIRGTANDIYFQIGLLVLIGLTAKNAILIVEFASQKLEEGLSPFDAAIEAAALRLRPIIMTSAAFVLGVAPMLVATGAGASARHSMGTGVFGGMLAATFIATIFVPVFFTWFARQRKLRK